MYGFEDLKQAQGILAWINNLGADDTAHIRQELLDLVFHATASLKALLDIVELVEDLDQKSLDAEAFRALFKVCRRFYLDPEAIEKCRTHCSDLFRDAERIGFKLARVGRTEIADIGLLTELVSGAHVAEDAYLETFDGCLENLRTAMAEVQTHFDEGNGAMAQWRFKKLKIQLTEGVEELRKTRELMRQTENRIRQILT